MIVMPSDEPLVFSLPDLQRAIDDIGGADGDLVTASRADIGGQVVPLLLVERARLFHPTGGNELMMSHEACSSHLLHLDGVSLELEGRSVDLRRGDFRCGGTGKLFLHAKLRRGGLIAVRGVQG